MWFVNRRIGGRIMMHKMCAAFIMSASVALALASSQAFGQSGAGHGGASASTHSTFRSGHQHNRRNAFVPTTGGIFWGPSNGVPNVEVAQPVAPISGDFTYTYKYDVPWDWAHRYPPSFFAGSQEPSAPPVAYRPGCAAQSVTVPGADGKDQTISVVRC